MSNVGEIIKEWRLKRGYSQGDLANKLGYPKSRCQGSIVSQWERGEKIPTLDTRKRLAKALKISVSKLI